MPESTAIYYFSGTGNSLSIAKDLKSKLEDAKLFSISALMKTPDAIGISGDVIGFVFPVYFGRVPVIVEEFLERVEFRDTNYIFAIANGGGAFCRTLRIFDKKLNLRNASLNAGFTVRMPGVHPKVHKFIKKTDEEFFMDKAIRINDLSEKIRIKEDHPIETNMGLLGMFMSHIFFKKVYEDSLEHKLDQVFRVNDSCRQCGTCQQVCPVENIELTNAGPKWLGKCVNCIRCYHMCPNAAIEMDDTMKRYKNPDVELCELAELQDL